MVSKRTRPDLNEKNSEMIKYYRASYFERNNKSITFNQILENALTALFKQENINVAVSKNKLQIFEMMERMDDGKNTKKN